MTDTREENSFGADIETVVNLMTGRCAGAVNDDNVEDAINKLLSRSIPPSTSVTSGDDHYKSSFSAVMLLRKVPYENRPHIVRDMGCYDVDGDEFQHETPCMNSSTSALPTTTVEQLLTENLKKCEVNWDEIPLGQIGWYAFHIDLLIYMNVLKYSSDEFPSQSVNANLWRWPQSSS